MDTPRINYHGCKVITTCEPGGPSIVSPKGVVYPYRLPKRRRWNIGLRKHVMELTGRIEVIFGNGVSLDCADWSQACEAVTDHDVRA